MFAYSHATFDSSKASVPVQGDLAQWEHAQVIRPEYLLRILGEIQALQDGEGVRRISETIFLNTGAFPLIQIMAAHRADPLTLLLTERLGGCVQEQSLQDERSEVYIVILGQEAELICLQIIIAAFSGYHEVTLDDAIEGDRGIFQAARASADTLRLHIAPQKQCPTGIRHFHDPRAGL